MANNPNIVDCPDNAPSLFSRFNGITVTHLSAGAAEGELIIGPNTLNSHGKVHGGALAALADTVAGNCACSKGGDCVTANSTMEFLRPAGGHRIFCRAVPKKLGKTLAVIQVELTDDEEKLVATGTFTFFMLP